MAKITFRSALVTGLRPSSQVMPSGEVWIIPPSPTPTNFPAPKQALRNELAKGAFDLLLVDYDLDDGKGDVLVKELLASGNTTPIIAVSSHDEGNATLRPSGLRSFG